EIPSEDGTLSRPSSLELLQNYPNPFNPSTTIKYRVDQSGSVNLTIFDELGRKVRTLVDENQSAGWHQIVWDGRNLSNQNIATGVYFYSLQSKNRTGVKKMIMLK
ncbi:T9SS type A sorting domain-containing protein, partial [candidate division KSB1 bacterium]|nr:T9SS type A sorting domain-containing protein [candidate division KSB1 bacterium]